MIYNQFFLVLRVFFLSFFLFYPTKSLAYEVFRDLEFEKSFKFIASRLLSSAGMKAELIKVFVVSDLSINAFVQDNKSIFLTRGIVDFAKDPNVLIGVVAHELGHMALDHNVMMESRVIDMQKDNAISYILGALTAIAVGPEAGAMLITAGSGFGLNKLMAYSRAMEYSADRYALDILDSSHYGKEGLLKVLKQFFISSGGISRMNADTTHPADFLRIAAVENYSEKFSVLSFTEKEMEYYKKARTKLLISFSDNVAISYYIDESDEELRVYAKFVELCRRGNFQEAINIITPMAESKTERSGFMLEARGRAFFKLGLYKKAVEDFKSASEIIGDPLEESLNFEISRSLLSTSPLDAKEFIESKLKNTSDLNDRNVSLYKVLALAEEKMQNSGMKYLNLAKYFFLTKRLDEAKKYALQAKQTLSKQDKLKNKEVLNILLKD